MLLNLVNQVVSHHRIGGYDQLTPSDGLVCVTLDQVLLSVGGDVTSDVWVGVRTVFRTDLFQTTLAASQVVSSSMAESDVLAGVRPASIAGKECR